MTPSSQILPGTFKRMLACALTAAAIAVPAGATDANQDATVHELDQLMLQWINAENHHDAAALGALLADAFVASFDQGGPISREAYLKGLTSGPADPDAVQELQDEKVLVDGDTAVTVLVNTMHGTSKGKHYDIKLRATITFSHRTGHWQALALQGVTLKPAS